MSTNKYAKDVSRIKILDPYRMQELYQMHPCAEHVVKKLLVPGERSGGKTLDQDISDCIQTLERWQAMRAEDAADNIDTTSVDTQAASLYDWRAVPAKFKWLAADHDGTVYAHVVEPRLSSLSNVGWNWNYDGTPGVCQHMVMPGIVAPRCSWQNSLEARP